MSYEKKIEIYVLKQNFNTPLASNPNKIANCKPGDNLVIIENEVYIKDLDDTREEQFARAAYSPEFVRINSVLFDKIS